MPHQIPRISGPSIWGGTISAKSTPRSPAETTRRGSRTATIRYFSSSARRSDRRGERNRHRRRRGQRDRFSIGRPGQPPGDVRAGHRSRRPGRQECPHVRRRGQFLMQDLPGAGKLQRVCASTEVMDAVHQAAGNGLTAASRDHAGRTTVRGRSPVPPALMIEPQQRGPAMPPAARL